MTMLSRFLSFFLTLLMTFSVVAFADVQQNSHKTNTNTINIASTITSYGKNSILIGGEINVPQGTARNTLALAGKANFGGVIARNAAISGADLTMNASIGHHAALLAGKLNLTENSSIGRSAIIVAGDANLSGHYLEKLIIIAGKVVISGEFDRDVTVIAGDITVTPSAKIAGKLKYLSTAPIQIQEGAILIGGVSKWKVEAPPKLAKPRPKPWYHSIPGLKFNLGLFLIALLMALIMPGFSRHSTDYLAEHPWFSLLAGFLTLVAVPVGAVILFFTVIGIPLALLLMSLYFAALFIGYIVISMTAGCAIVKLFNKSEEGLGRGLMVLGALMGLILIYLLRAVPYIGFWIGCAAILFGLGAVVLATFHCCSSNKMSKSNA